jgi:uncharacterized membrane protein YebE (DUF533 family)
MSDEKLGRDVFLALAAIARADGKIERDELDALVRAAREQGLGDDDVHAIEAAATGGATVQIHGERFAPAERLFIYAMAYWISRIDGEMSEDEDKVLGKLGADLALADDVRMGAEGAVDEVAALPQGDRPARFDITRLRALLALAT